MYVRASKCLYWLSIAFLFLWSLVNFVYTYNLPWHYYYHD